MNVNKTTIFVDSQTTGGTPLADSSAAQANEHRASQHGSGHRRQPLTGIRFFTNSSLRIVAILSITLIGLSGQTAKTKTALDEANELEQRVQSALKAGDQQARISADLELFHLLNGSPTVVEALARAYAASGDTEKALAALNQFADLGQADEGLLDGTDHRFSSIENLPEYKSVLARFAKNRTPVSLSRAAFVIPDAGLVPEDIDYDSSSRSFLVTSILERKIVRIRPGRSVVDFALSPDGWPMVAIKIDGGRNRVWATEVAFDGFQAAPKSAWGRSAVLCFDLHSGTLLQRIEMHSSLGDMVLTPQGEPIVSDGDSGVLYRMSNGRMNPINTVDFISPQTPALLNAGEQFFVPDYVRGLGRFDPQKGSVVWLSRNGEDKVALNGIDGLYLHGHWLIATQNGASPERVILLKLDPSLTHIIASKMIEGAGCDPTHGVVVGNDFYYIANSGWAKLDENGNVKAGSNLTAALIMRYKL
jgi:hypothetical protein